MFSSYPKWCIIGHFSDPYGYEDDRDDVVALFTTKDKAERYLNQATLKNPTYRRRFKRRSLLAIYNDASIEKCYPENHIIDPI